jgi:hypothetical protein
MLRLSQVSQWHFSAEDGMLGCEDSQEPLGFGSLQLHQAKHEDAGNGARHPQDQMSSE